MNPVDVESILELTTELKFGKLWSSEMADKLKYILLNNPCKTFKTIETFKHELISGELQIEDLEVFGGLGRILNVSNEEEKSKILQMLIEKMSSHNTGLLIYGKILDIEYEGKNDEKFSDRIVYRLEEIRKKSRNNPVITSNAREFFDELKRISYYKDPYIPSTGEAIGYLEDGDTKMLEIGEEEREIARQYLRNESDIECYYSMKTALMKLAKGEITSDSVSKRAAEIARMKKEKELAECMAQDEILDEKLKEKVSEEITHNS